MDAVNIATNGTVIVQTQPTTDFTNIWIGLVTAIILGIGLFLNWKEITNTKKAVIEEQKISYVQLLNEFDKDLTEREQKISQVKTVDDSIGFAIDILNMLDRMAHLYYKNAITYETINYFKDMFPYGLALEEWLVVNELMDEDEVRHGSWIDFNEFCGRQKIVAFDIKELPTKLLEIDQLILEEESRDKLDEIRNEIEIAKSELIKMKKELSKMKKETSKKRPKK